MFSKGSADVILIFITDPLELKHFESTGVIVLPSDRKLCMLTGFVFISNRNGLISGDNNDEPFKSFRDSRDQSRKMSVFGYDSFLFKQPRRYAIRSFLFLRKDLQAIISRL